MNQDLAYDPAYGSGGAFGLLGWVIILGLWVYLGYCMYKMAQKCGCSDSAWWGFVPILSTFLLIKMAQKPLWWFVLCLIPVVNIVAFFVMWIEAAKYAGSTALWGFLVMIPFINLVALGVLAFSSPKRLPHAPPQTAPPRREEVGV
jgi:hypothetical protein